MESRYTSRYFSENPQSQYIDPKVLKELKTEDNRFTGTRGHHNPAFSSGRLSERCSMPQWHRQIKFTGSSFNDLLHQCRNREVPHLPRM